MRSSAAFQQVSGRLSAAAFISVCVMVVNKKVLAKIRDELNDVRKHL